MCEYEWPDWACVWVSMNVDVFYQRLCTRFFDSSKMWRQLHFFKTTCVTILCTKCSERKGKNKPIVGNSNKTFWGYIWRHSSLWNEVEDFFGRFLTWTKSKCAQRMMQPRGKCWNCDCILIYRRNDLQLHLALQNCTWFHANSSSNTIACNQFGVRMEGAIN